MSATGMKNEPTAKLVAGVGHVYIAPSGTAWPIITGPTLTWIAAWIELTVATDGGYAFRYKETVSDHKIDQQLMPVMKTPDTAEGDLTLELASMDHAILEFVVSNATKVPTPAAVGIVGNSLLGIGGSAIKEFQIGIEGLSPASPLGSTWWEMVKIWRCVPSSELKKTYKKGEKQMVSCKFDVMADLSQAHPVCEIIQMTAVALP